MNAYKVKRDIALSIGGLIGLTILFGCNSFIPASPYAIVDLPFKNASTTNIVSSGVAANSMDGEAIDIDKDGDTDIVIAMEFRPNVILINDGTGKLVDESDKRLPRDRHDSEDIAIADFDKDGDDDLVFVSEDDFTNEYYENKGNAFFEAKNSKIPVSGKSNAVKTADIDKDGDADLLIGNEGQNFILINKDGNFLDETAKRLPQNDYTTQDLELADVDGDGDLDLLEGNETYNRLLINDGKGVFTFEKERLPEVNDQTRDADFGDADGDGDLDIFFSNVNFGGFGDPQNRLLLNDGKGRFTEVTKERLPVDTVLTVDSDFVDIDNDGDQDIVGGNGLNGSMVLENDGKGKFTDKTRDFFPELGGLVVDFQIADFNNDGKKDIYICQFRGRDLLLFGTKY